MSVCVSVCVCVCVCVLVVRGKRKKEKGLMLGAKQGGGTDRLSMTRRSVNKLRLDHILSITVADRKTCLQNYHSLTVTSL